MSFERETAEAVALLKALINIPRTSRNETEAADYLQHAMEQRGLKTYRKDNNLWTMSPNWDAQKPTLLINAHIDTVKPVAGWQTEPNCAIEENGRIIGLGSNDDGASLVSLLAVFGLLTQHSQKHIALIGALAINGRIRPQVGLPLDNVPSGLDQCSEVVQTVFQ